jgi:hypothetical protein
MQTGEDMDKIPPCFVDTWPAAGLSFVSFFVRTFGWVSSGGGRTAVLCVEHGVRAFISDNQYQQAYMAAASSTKS